MMSRYRQERVFGSVLACIMAALALWPLLDHNVPSLPWGIATLTLFLMTWLTPLSLTPILKVWLKFGHILGIINTHLLLGIAFFLFITPIALLFKLIGRDALALRFQQKASYWKNQNKTWSPESFKQQF